MARSVGRTPRRLRGLAFAAWAIIASGLLVAGGLVSFVPASSALAVDVSASETAASTVDASIVKAADLSQFKAGNIISDAVFFNSATMTEAQIQSFLESKVSSCRSGYTCLKDYYVQTRSIAADAMCGAYSGGGSERASRVIYKVAQACGINPQVILVMLQKEQGLITSTAPSSWAYQAAMGQGCPDTAACDARYYGLFNQVYGGAWQLKRYANPPGTSNYFTWYAPGKIWHILYHPNSGCGRGPVYIENQATANLYYYTPYQPNAAAIAAGYGTGDSCSSYGNRNFFNYFTDWFGSTQDSVATVVRGRYEQLGGEDGYLGSPVTGLDCGLVRGGCYQAFEGGAIYVTPAGGVFDVASVIRPGWAPSFEGGSAGYPTGNTVCGLTRGGCYQVFEGGVVYSSKAGAHLLTLETHAAFTRVSSEWGTFGYPVGSQVCGLARGGCYQPFEGGLVFHTPAGYSFAVGAEVRAGWGPDYEWGTIGYPTGDLVCGLARGGCYQAFEGGLIYRTPSAASIAVGRDNAAEYSSQHAEWGLLGYPVSQRVCGLAQGGCYQAFEGGLIYSSPSSGVHSVRPEVRALWATYDLEWGALGFPTSSPPASGGTYEQTFQGGVVAVVDGKASLKSASDPWLAELLSQSWLGYPVSQRVCGLAQGGCYQAFEGGLIYSSPSSGVHSVRPEVRALWATYDLEWGALGFPTSSPPASGGTYEQTFQGGVVAVVDGKASLKE